VKLIFEATEPQVLVFGSAEDTSNSARKLLKAKKAVTTPLEIDLPAGSETVPAFTFTAGTTSPATVVSNGNGRTLRLQSGSAGSIISVGSGVTLTLREITLEGHGTNTEALVTVLSGGTLILESGAVIRDLINTSFDGAGGVLVDGGTLTMNGGTITGNTGDDGGGVQVEGADGQFTLSGGTISSNQARSSGGGIYLNSAKTVSISNASIRNNTADFNGGGIYAYDTPVTMGNSSVTDNSSNQGGGVYFQVQASSKTFTMTGGSISRNDAGDIGGGVYVSSINTGNTIMASFNMEDGEIRTNTAQPYFGAGVYLSKCATLGMKGRARVDQNNRVCIGNENSRINITGTLVYDPAANIEGTISSGDQVLTGNTSSNYEKFRFDGYTNKFTTDGKLK
jgi:hypothetical protein